MRMVSKKEVTKTKVDYFLDLVNERKEIALKDAAKEIGVSFEIAGLWADTLEEQGKLEIEYKVATPYLISLNKKRTDSQSKGFASMVKKPKQNRVDVLKDKFITANVRIQDPTLKEKYKKLIGMLIYNYNLLNKKDLEGIARNYRSIHALLTPEIAEYISKNDKFVQAEVWCVYSLVLVYEGVKSLNLTDKSNVNYIQSEVMRLKKLEDFLKKRKEYKEAIDYINNKIKKG